VSALQAIGVAADYLSSTRSAAERKHILDQLTPSSAAAAMAAGSNGSNDRLALLYVTPELIATDRCDPLASLLQLVVWKQMLPHFLQQRCNLSARCHLQSSSALD